MNDKIETGLPSLIVLIVILICFFIFNPNVKNIGSLKYDEITSQLAQMQAMSSDNQNNMNYNFGQVPNSKMKKMSKPLAEYLIENGYASKAEFGKKMVIYTNVYDLSCPYQERMLQDIEGYKNSPDWLQRYTFVEHRTQKRQSKTFNSDADLKKFKEFNDNCAIFCVIDFANGSIYRGTKKGDSEYLYKTLGEFYR